MNQPPTNAKLQETTFLKVSCDTNTSQEKINPFATAYHKPEIKDDVKVLL